MAGRQWKAPARGQALPGLGGRHANAAGFSNISHDARPRKAEPATLREARLRALGLSASRAALLAAMIWGAVHG